MAYDKNGRARCDGCNKYAVLVDSYTPFGCANPADPEPYDPTDFCEKCADERYKMWLREFERGSRNGDWCKSNGEIRAAKESGLVWIGNTGTLKHKETGQHLYNRYILAEEKENYEPYLSTPSMKVD